MPRALRVLLVALPSFLWVAPAAVAQGEGVFIDPGSPTGKEYAIPIESARRQADPSGGSAGASPGSAPLFGAGITPSRRGGAGEPSGQVAGTDAPTGGSNAAGSQKPAQAGHGGDSATEAPAASKEADAALEAAIRTPGAPSGGLDAPAIIALVAGGLLLAGALIGIVIRRARG